MGGNVFIIRNGTCEVDWSAYSELRTKVDKMLKLSMGKTLKEIPINRDAMADDLLDQFLPLEGTPDAEKRAKEMCEALVNGEKPKVSGTIADKKGERPPFNAEKEKEHGFFTAKADVQLVSCTKEPDQYYFNGDPTCEDVAGAIKGQFLPAALYFIPMSHKQAMGDLENSSNWPLYSKEHEVPKLDDRKAPIACIGPRGEQAIYSYPYQSTFWDLRYIIGSVLNDYDATTSYAYWFQLPYCTVEDVELKESKLMFDYGSRIFFDLGVEIDGRRAAETMAVSYIAAFPANSFVRARFMKSAPYHFYF
jgi:hypothetical protein